MSPKPPPQSIETPPNPAAPQSQRLASNSPIGISAALSPATVLAAPACRVPPQNPPAPAATPPSGSIYPPQSGSCSAAQSNPPGAIGTVPLRSPLERPVCESCLGTRTHRAG